MQGKHIILFSTLYSFFTSLVLCSVFLHANALTVQATGAGIPLKNQIATTTNSNTSSSYIDTTPSGSSTAYGSNNCTYFYDTQSSCSSCGSGCQSPWYKADVFSGYSGSIDNTRYVATTYSAQCNDGEVMTGYQWGQVWGNRYAMIPECAKITYTVKHI